MANELMLERIGWEIAERGIDEASLRPVLTMARDLQVAAVATAVLADTSQTDVARWRAFDRVSSALRAAVASRQRFTLAA